MDIIDHRNGFADQDACAVMTRWHTFGCLCVVLVAVVHSASAEQQLESAYAHQYAHEVAPFLKQHCLACHGAEKQEGDVRFDGPMPDLVDGEQAERWLTAKQLISQGQMPPEGRPRPTADELTTVLAWIDEAAARAATVTRGGIGRRALRRLTPREYVTAAMDVLGLSFPHFQIDISARLAQDTGSEGFSNDSNLQSTQPLLLRRSLDLAEQLVDVALPDPAELAPFDYTVDLRKYVAAVQERLEKKTGGHMAYRVDLPGARDGEKPPSLALEGKWTGGRKRVAAERLDAERGVVLQPNPVLIGPPMEGLVMKVPRAISSGVLRFRAQAGGNVPAGEASPVLRLSITRQEVAVPIGEIVVTAPADAPAEYVLDVPLAFVNADWKGIHRDRQLALQIDNSAALPYPTPRDPGDKRKDQEIPLPKRSELILSSLALQVVAAPSRASDLLAPETAGQDDRERARRSLAAMLARAFRRPAHDGEVAAYLGLYDAERTRGSSFLAAYKAALTAAVISPQMFYLVEPKDTQQRPLTGWELASRLSYLAWGTSPDDELRGRAADGSLLREDELRRQLNRLLDDPRSDEFCREFVRQWLRLDTVLHLSAKTFTQKTINQAEDVAWYETALLHDIAAEPPHFFQELLRRNGPIGSFVDADFVVVNERLARFYGIDGVSGHEFRAVPAPPDRRGGLLTQAGCIASASHGRERSEILRGVYLIERFLGIDIPTPPGNVQPLDVQLSNNQNLRKLTPRQHVEAHSSVNTCAVCHLRIDPLGFVWDQYDIFGRMRRDKDGKVITAVTNGRLPDKTPFADLDEFRRLLNEPTSTTPLFADAFQRRLYAYVLGRGLDHGDEQHLRSMASTTAKTAVGLRDLLTAMVLSVPFRNK
jgi:mono/diheme cytochrome c family protein